MSAEQNGRATKHRLDYVPAMEMLRVIHTSCDGKTVLTGYIPRERLASITFASDIDDAVSITPTVTTTTAKAPRTDRAA